MFHLMPGVCLHFVSCSHVSRWLGSAWFSLLQCTRGKEDVEFHAGSSNLQATWWLLGRGKHCLLEREVTGGWEGQDLTCGNCRSKRIGSLPIRSRKIEAEQKV